MQSKIEIDSRVHKIELHNNPIVVRVNKFNEESAQKFGVVAVLRWRIV